MTSKERAHFRSMANTLQPIFQIGKNGISENTIKQFAKESKAKGNSINEGDYLITSLEFLSILKKKQLLGRFIDDGNNKRIDKLTYLNDSISEQGKLKFDVFLRDMERFPQKPPAKGTIPPKSLLAMC